MKKFPARESPHEQVKHCEVPPGIGRLYNPPHPAYGIAFLYVVSQALLFGTRAGPATSLHVTFSHLGLWVCLLGAVHFLERVDLSHVVAKLGGARPSVSWFGIAVLAALPGLVLYGTRGFETTLWAAVGSTALWQESFYRGFVFRSLMRRHGFLLSALVASGLGAMAVLLHGTGNVSGALLVAALVEMVLGMALCQLFGLAGAGLWPCVLVRVSVLLVAEPGGRLGHPGPSFATAVLLWLLVLGFQKTRSKRHTNH